MLTRDHNVVVAAATATKCCDEEGAAFLVLKVKYHNQFSPCYMMTVSVVEVVQHCNNQGNYTGRDFIIIRRLVD